MYNHAPLDYVCPFCLIAAGRDVSPAQTGQEDVVYRDELVTAFIALDWRRNNPGHALVVPNRHHENLYDLPAAESARIQWVIRDVALAMKRSYGCDGISTVQHNEPAGNQHVWHYHVHVFPRYVDDDVYRSPTRTTTPEERAPYAERLRRELAMNGASERTR